MKKETKFFLLGFKKKKYLIFWNIRKSIFYYNYNILINKLYKLYYKIDWKKHYKIFKKQFKFISFN